jgi:serine/threonine-protein kinase RsbT
MDMATQRVVSVHVGSEFDVALLVGTVGHFCRSHGLPPLLAAHVATAASELANNLWMHADGGGHVSLALLCAPAGIELVAEDQGPGIVDLGLALSEGYSTAGSLGCGLPGVQRLMDEFSIDSAAGRGTRVVARKWQRP